MALPEYAGFARVSHRLGPVLVRYVARSGAAWRRLRTGPAQWRSGTGPMGNQPGAESGAFPLMAASDGGGRSVCGRQALAGDLQGLSAHAEIRGSAAGAVRRSRRRHDLSSAAALSGAGARGAD